MEFTFDTFRVDKSNRFAHAAARAVVEAPGRSYDPLWIYGPTGAGKTHLLGAMERMIKQEHRHTTVGHASLMNFEALNRYADDAHVLLLDDAENLRDSCEMFTRFNNLMVSTLAEDYQVVIAGQTRYGALHRKCCDHVLSRLPWWLEVDISHCE